jgi:hypothetical protein
MQLLRFILVAFLIGGGVLTDSALAARAKKKAAVKPAAVASTKASTTSTAKTKAAKSATAGPPAPTRVRTASRSWRRGSRYVAHVTYAPRQAQPSKERYAEIQQALTQKGYFSGETTGEWKADSVEALKRFQDDQSLQPSGKINSLSLIALGLGPKRSSVTVVPVIAPAAGNADAATDEEPVQLPVAPIVEQQQ